MKWLKRIGCLIALLLALVVALALIPVGRYAWLIAEEASLNSAEELRLATPPAVASRKADGGALATSDAGVRAGCVAGLVLGADQSPAAGVAVSAAPRTRTERSCSLCAASCDCAALIEAIIDDPVELLPFHALAGTTTDADGRFLLCELPPGRTSVWAEGAAQQTAELTVELPAPPVRLVLRGTTAKVRGRVFDAQQHGIAGATVAIVSLAGGATQRVTTEANGTFEATLPSVRFSLFVRAAGFMPRQLLALRPNQPPIAIQLERTDRVVVTVVDEKGTVAGAEVTAQSLGRRQRTNAAGQTEFTTGERERFTARGASGKGQVNFERPPGHTVANVTIRLKPTGVVTGTVVHANAGVAGAKVEAIDRRTTDDLPTVVTDAQGRFELSDLELGDNIFIKASHDHCSGDAVANLDTSTHVTVQLDCDRGLSGTVVTRAGEPLPGADINATCSEKKLETVTDTEGRFSIDAPRGVCIINIIDVRVAAARVITAAPKQGLVITVDEGASVTGRVVDEAGVPVSDAILNLIHSTVVQSFVDYKNDGSRLRLSTASDLNGEFLLGGLRPGRYELTFGLRENLCLHVVPRIVVGAGQHVALGDVVLKATAVVSGVVLDESGQPVSSAHVDRLHAGGELARTAEFISAIVSASTGDFQPVVDTEMTSVTTAADGSFSIENARALDGVEVSADGFETQTAPAKLGQFVTVRLKRAKQVRVTGRVIARGGPLTEFSIDGRSYADADGRFDVLVQVSGETTLVVRADQHLSRKVNFTPNAVTLAPVALGDIELEPDGEVTTTISVVGPEGPISKATVMIVSEPSDEEAHDYTGHEGRVRISRPPSEATVRARAKGYEEAQQRIDANATELQIRLSPATRTIEGVARGLDERPAEGAVVSAGWSNSVVDAQGHFVLEHLDRDDTVVVLTTPELVWSKTISKDTTHVEVGAVSSGGTVELTLRSAGPIVLTHGTLPTIDSSTLLDSSSSVGDDFVRSPLLTVGAYRLTGLSPGMWSVAHLSLSERGLPALLNQVRLTPQTIEVHQGEVTRLTLE